MHLSNLKGQTMTVYICPVTSLQYTVSSDTSKEASMLWPHPSSKSRESILALENKLKRLHGILVYYKILEPIKDLSEVSIRSRLIASLSLTDNDIQILLFKLNTRKAPGINTNNPRELQTHLIKIIAGDFSPTMTIFEIDNSKETKGKQEGSS